jgi:hypothetical protein
MDLHVGRISGSWCNNRYKIAAKLALKDRARDVKVQVILKLQHSIGVFSCEFILKYADFIGMRSINPTYRWPWYEVRYPSRIHAPLEFLPQTTVCDP